MPKKGMQLARRQLQWKLERLDKNISYALEQLAAGNCTPDDVHFVKCYTHTVALNMCHAFHQTCQDLDLQPSKADARSLAYHKEKLDKFIGHEEMGDDEEVTTLTE